MNNLPRFIRPGLGFASTDLPWFYVLPQLIDLWFISVFRPDLWIASTNSPWFTIFLNCLVYDWHHFINHFPSHLIWPLAHSPWFMILLNWTLLVYDWPKLILPAWWFASVDPFWFIIYFNWFILVDDLPRMIHHGWWFASLALLGWIRSQPTIVYHFLLF